MSDDVERKGRRWHTVVPCALGEVTLVRDADQLRGLYFPHHWYMPDQASFGPCSNDGFAEATTQLQEYLAGSRQDFDLAFAADGDPFQRRVWSAVSEIDYGQTVTYGELATTLGGDVTAQQVGAAMGRNPLCIFIPCHRVVGSGGKLTGYAGGVRRKQHLLELEAAHASSRSGTPLQQTLLSGLW